MANRGWGRLLPLVALAVCLAPSALRAEPGPCPRPVQVGYVVVPSAGEGCRYQVLPYYPQAGDLLLYDYFNSFHTFAFEAVGTGAPVHTGIVFTRADGMPVVLDIAGPKTLTAKVVLLDIGPRLKNYKGAILVRRPRQPLTCERSAALTEFALAQEGKAFAVGRLALQGTPLRARTCRWLGCTCLDRKRWICSELCVAAATVAGLVDPTKHFANAFLPRDLAYNETFDLSATFHVPVLWVPDPCLTIQGDTVSLILKDTP